MAPPRSRKPLIAGNWKMHLTVRESLNLAREVASGTKGVVDREVAVFPAHTALHAVARELEGSPVKAGSQDHHFEDSGAFTGEVSAPQVRDAGASYALAGHSERRHVFGETDPIVNKKVRAALRAGLKPVLCVGERLEERDGGRTMEIVSRHVREGLKDVGRSEAINVTIAYEPVWAIGTGRVATPEQAQEVHAFVRGLVREIYGKDVAEDMRILYGGSVKPDNVDGLMAMPDLDGTLVGGASLEGPSFVRIVKFVDRAWN